MKSTITRCDTNAITNSDGYVLVTAMLMLLILTLIGIAATSTATFELQISGNDKRAKQVFYDAESAAYEGAQRVANETDSDHLKPGRSRHKWLISTQDKYDYVNNASKWNNNQIRSGMSTTENLAGVVALGSGVIKGDKAASIKMTNSTVYGFQILGNSQHGKGSKTIEIGFKKRI